MSIRVWENDLIGVLEEPNREENQYRDSIFVNTQNSLQLAVRIISQQPDSMPNVKSVTVFNSDLEQWGFEDDYTEPDHIRKERLRDWLEGCLLVFKVERRVKYDHEEVFNAKEVRVIAKHPSFHQEVRLMPVPVFSEGTHGLDGDEFAYSLANRKFVGRIANVSHEANDTPSMVLWRDEQGDEEQYHLFGEFESHQYAYGGFSFWLSGELKSIAFKEEWMEECYMVGGADDVIYVPLHIYQDMTLGLEEAPVTNEPAQTEKVLTEVESGRLAKNEVAVALVEEKTEPLLDHHVQDGEQVFLESFYEHTRESGHAYDGEDLIHFHTSMKSSNLVILSGMSGTGKSRLVDLYSAALGLKGDQHTVIPVSPSWTSDSDLIGYADTMHMVYRPSDSGLINALRKAEKELNKLFVICFDEMNLARVEHYFSQFLSILELDAGKRVLRLYNDDLENRLYNSAQYPPTISIHDNVLFVGTVNVDESTYHFSDKVLDRANVLNLAVMPFTELKRLPEKKKLLASRKEEVDTDTYRSYKQDQRSVTLSDAELELLWEIHHAFQSIHHQIGIGPRIVKQIDYYLANLPAHGSVTRMQGLDAQMVQRVWTKLRGSEEQLRGLVGTLSKEGEVQDSLLVNLLNRYEHLSTFSKSRKIIQQKAKELKFNGYTF